MSWRRHAEEDLTEAHLFVGSRSPEAAERLLDAVEEAVCFLQENPCAGHLRGFGSPAARGIRSWVVKGFPSYLIFYRAVDARLEIVRMLHGARDLPRLLEEN